MVADARHESAAGVSRDRPSTQVALSATDQSEERRGPRAAPRTCRGAGAVLVSAAAHPARGRRIRRESQARASDLSGGGLQVRRRRRKRLTRAERVPLPSPSHRLERWSMDFTADTLADGRNFRTLNIVDDFTRECYRDRGRPLAAGSPRDVRARSAPRRTRFAADDRGRQRAGVCGPHARRVAYARGVTLRFIRPGKDAPSSPSPRFRDPRHRDAVRESDSVRRLRSAAR